MQKNSRDRKHPDRNPPKAGKMKVLDGIAVVVGEGNSAFQCWKKPPGSQGRGQGLKLADGIDYSNFIGGSAPPVKDVNHVNVATNPPPPVQIDLPDDTPQVTVEAALVRRRLKVEDRR